jgi:hypothetical protein
MWPILTKFIPGTPATDVWATKDVVLSLANNFVKQAGSVGLAWQSQVMANPGEAWNATTTLIKAAVGGLAGQAQVRQALYGLACSLTRGSSIPSGTLDVLEKFVGNLYGAIKAVDAVMTGGDIGSIYYEVANSNNLNAWDVRAQTATLIMVPQSQTVNDPAQGVPFSVTVNGGPTASPASGSRSRYYNWSCGAFATLSDGKTTGTSIVASLSQAVTYKVTGTTLPSSPDTVTVTVFDPAGNEMGTVSGKVLFGNPWVGTWPGHVTSTCGYYSGPQTLRISSPGGNQLNFGVGYSGTFDGNTATSTNGKVVFTLDGNTIHGAEADSCQIGLYTRQ